MQEIAVATGRNTSTTSRELRRNADPTTGLYLPATVDRLAAGRVARPRPRRVTRDEELHAVVVELLSLRRRRCTPLWTSPCAASMRRGSTT